MKLPKPNIKAIHEAAQKIKNSSGKAGSDGPRDEIAFYDWVTEGKNGSDGKNYLRVLPPWSDSGDIFKRLYTWHLGDLGNWKHPNLSWPTEAPIDDPMDQVIAKLEAEFPQFISLHRNDKIYGRAVQSCILRQRYWGNVVDRRDEEKGSQVCGFPKMVAEWFIALMSDLLTQGIDITDVYTGVDICVTKSPNVKMWYEYTPMGTNSPSGFTPLQSPVSENNSLLEQWVTARKNIDQIFKYPNRDKLNAYKTAADKFYIRMKDILSKLYAENAVQDADKQPQDIADLDAQPLPEPATSAAAPPEHTGVKAKPKCFRDHQPEWSKCLRCPYEIDCDELTETQGRVEYDWSQDPQQPEKLVR